MIEVHARPDRVLSPQGVVDESRQRSAEGLIFPVFEQQERVLELALVARARTGGTENGGGAFKQDAQRCGPPAPSKNRPQRGHAGDRSGTILSRQLRHRTRSCGRFEETSADLAERREKRPARQLGRARPACRGRSESSRFGLGLFLAVDAERRPGQGVQPLLADLLLAHLAMAEIALARSA